MKYSDEKKVDIEKEINKCKTCNGLVKINWIYDEEFIDCPTCKGLVVN